MEQERLVMTSPRHAAPGRHEAPRSVWRTPGDGPVHIPRSKANLLMEGWHDELNTDLGCERSPDTPPKSWHDCEAFAAARIRGMHHTMFVVPMPYDPKVSTRQRYAILDIFDDPVQCQLREGFDGYHVALMFAAAHCATELAREMDY